MPETATRKDVLSSRSKRAMVARAVYEELVGMEESERRIHGGLHGTPVAVRFPGGYREIEPLVVDVSKGPGEDSPYSATLQQLRRERDGTL